MKSKLNIKSILIIAIIGIISFVFFNPSFAANTAKITVETANIRKTPDLESTILEQASKDQEVEILEKTGDWYKIKYKGITGYLRNDLLDVADAETTTSLATEIKQEEPVTEQPKVEETTTETKNENTTETATEIQEENTTETATEIQDENATETATEIQDENATENVIYTCKEDTKLKIMPLIMGTDIKELSKDAIVNIIEINNKWALVECGNERGWILYDKIQKTSSENVVSTTVETNTEPQAEESNNKEVQEEKVEEKPTESKTETTTETTTETQEQETAPVEENKTENTETATQEKTMYVNSEVINLRKEESTSSESLAKLAKGTKVTVTAENNGWSKVSVNGNDGYIASSLLSETKPEVPTSRSSEEPRQDVENTQNNNEKTTSSSTETKTETKAETSTTSTNSSKGQEVCNYAKQFLGCKYVYGGTTPKGFDCSGFTQYVYKHFGVTLNRTAEAQASNGKAVLKSNLKPGDLLIFTSHAGIYLGNGKFIHAANSKKGVIITSLSDSYYVKNYITARRIFN